MGRRLRTCSVLGLGLLGVVTLASTSGCSVWMAAHQPEKKDLRVFDPGTPRSLIVAEVGAPIDTTMRAGKKVETYAFTQGYDKLNKGTRAAFHGTADVLTLGLWEVVGTTTEAVVDGDYMIYEVIFTKNDDVESSKLVKKQILAGKKGK